MAASAPVVPTHTLRIGVLAMQGAFREHVQHLNDLNGIINKVDLGQFGTKKEARFCIEAFEVRTRQDMERLDGLVIPGGESTAIIKAADACRLTDAIQQYLDSSKPVWGTCAGLILLSKNVLGQKQGGQHIIGGLDVTASRNFFGRQKQSFEAPLLIDPSAAEMMRFQLKPGAGSAEGDIAKAPEDAFDGDASSNGDESKASPATAEVQEPSSSSSSVRKRKPVWADVAREHALPDLKRQQQRLRQEETVAVLSKLTSPPNTGVFIRAPAVVDVLDRDKVSVLATLRLSPSDVQLFPTIPDALRQHAQERASSGQEPQHKQEEQATGGRDVIVGVMQDNILATAFHPELTPEYQWHLLFVKMVIKHLYGKSVRDS